MAAITTYVNCSSVGGDGTTNNESGATAAYASLSSWEANEQTDLVAAGDTHTVECDLGSTDVDGDTTTVTVAGWTAGASNWIKIIPSPDGLNGSGNDQRHAGTFDTSKYYLNVAGGIFSIQDEYVTVEGIQGQTNRAGSDTWVFFGNGSNYSRITKALIRKNAGSGPTNLGIICNRTAALNQADNCVVWNEAAGATLARGIGNDKTSGAVGTFHAYCNTVENATTGYICQVADGTLARNNIAAACTTAFDSTAAFASGTDYNMTENASMGYTVTGGAPANDQSSATLGFTNQTTHDFHITASSTADGNGTASFPSALFSVTEDVEGEARAGDIGADELVAAGVAFPAWQPTEMTAIRTI